MRRPLLTASAALLLAAGLGLTTPADASLVRSALRQAGAPPWTKQSKAGVPIQGPITFLGPIRKLAPGERYTFLDPPGQPLPNCWWAYLDNLGNLVDPASRNGTPAYGDQWIMYQPPR